jgi:hypothetical protein
MAERKRSSSRRSISSTARREVRTEMLRMRGGKHKVKSKKQAIAIGPSKARKKGAKTPKKRAR